MSDLPPVKYLDRAIMELAAESHGDPAYCNWSQASDYPNLAESTRASIIAHARTLEKLAQHEPGPADADEAAFNRVLNAFGYSDPVSPRITESPSYKAAIAQYKAERLSLSDVSVLQDAVIGVVSATRAYLPPDGISPHECINRVLEATDNLVINPIIEAIEAAMLKRDPTALEAFRGVGRG